MNSTPNPPFYSHLHAIGPLRSAQSSNESRDGSSHRSHIIFSLSPNQFLLKNGQIRGNIVRLHNIVDSETFLKGDSFTAVTCIAVLLSHFAMADHSMDLILIVDCTTNNEHHKPRTAKDAAETHFSAQQSPRF